LGGDLNGDLDMQVSVCRELARSFPRNRDPLPVVYEPMKHRRGRAVVLGAVVAFSAVILAASPAFAKGPSQGVITGPGLAQPITLREPGSATIGPDLANVVTQSGFFVGMWGGTDAHGRLTDRPAGNLGPRYTITYTMAFPDRPSSDIVQYVFPYAELRPVTFMPPNQEYWGNAQTEGAWFAGNVGLRKTLIRFGLPTTPPSGGKSPSIGSDVTYATNAVSGGSLMILVWIAGAFSAVAFAATLAMRRRPRHSLDA
jgi:hypothetical protein